MPKLSPHNLPSASTALLSAKCDQGTNIGKFRDMTSREFRRSDSRSRLGFCTYFTHPQEEQNLPIKGSLQLLACNMATFHRTQNETLHASTQVSWCLLQSTHSFSLAGIRTFSAKLSKAVLCCLLKHTMADKATKPVSSLQASTRAPLTLFRRVQVHQKCSEAGYRSWMSGDACTHGQGV